MQTRPAKIYDFLYLGSYKNAKDVALLKELGITAVVNCANEYKIIEELMSKTEKERKVELKDSNQIDFLFLDLYDDNRVQNLPLDLDHSIEQAIDFINRHKSVNNKVLIHCHLGISRAATIALAYVMRQEKLDYSQALAKLRNLPDKPIIMPNRFAEDFLATFE